MAFQWIDIQMYTGPPLAKNPDESQKSMPGVRRGMAPIIQLFGITEEGHSILAHVHGTVPYFYTDVPDADNFSEKHLGDYRLALEARIKGKIGANRQRDGANVMAVIPVQKQTVMGYQHNKMKPMLQVFFICFVFILGGAVGGIQSRGN